MCNTLVLLPGTKGGRGGGVNSCAIKPATCSVHRGRGVCRKRNGMGAYHIFDFGEFPGACQLAFLKRTSLPNLSVVTKPQSPEAGLWLLMSGVQTRCRPRALFLYVSSPERDTVRFDRHAVPCRGKRHGHVMNRRASAVSLNYGSARRSVLIVQSFGSFNSIGMAYLSFSNVNRQSSKDAHHRDEMGRYE